MAQRRDDHLPSGFEVRAWPKGGTRPEATMAMAPILAELNRIHFARPNWQNFDFEVDFVHVVEMDLTIGTEYCQVNDTSAYGAATIFGEGSASLVANNLALVATPVPDNVPWIFFFSAGSYTPGLPFGHGFRCICPQVTRLPASIANGNVLRYAIDLPTQAPLVTVGSSWHFQAWFRDTDAGAPGFNTSNAQTIQFDF
ncbi:MAG: hypothetical protein ACI9F9_001137 [Candidatus Paceibacteria bacterium]|jgi:hypothetical protein